MQQIALVFTENLIKVGIFKRGCTHLRWTLYIWTQRARIVYWCVAAFESVHAQSKGEAGVRVHRTEKDRVSALVTWAFDVLLPTPPSGPQDVILYAIKSWLMHIMWKHQCNGAWVCVRVCVCWCCILHICSMHNERTHMKDKLARVVMMGEKEKRYDETSHRHACGYRSEEKGEGEQDLMMWMKALASNLGKD